MKVEIEGELYHAVPNPYGSCLLRNIPCAFRHISCIYVMHKCSKPDVVFFTDENFTKWLAARLTA